MSPALPSSEIIEGGGGIEFCCRVSWHVRRGANGHGPGSEAGRRLQAQPIAPVWRIEASLSSTQKEEGTYVDLGAVEAVLVHHPVESNNRRQRQVRRAHASPLA